MAGWCFLRSFAQLWFWYRDMQKCGFWLRAGKDLSSNTSKNQTSGHWRCKTMRKLQMCKNVKDISIFIQATIPPRGIEILWTKHSTWVGNPLINWRLFFCIPFQLRQSIRVSKYVEAGIRHEIHPLQQINGHWLIGFLACNDPGAHNTSKPSMRAVSAARGNTCNSLKTERQNMAKPSPNKNHGLFQTRITACLSKEMGRGCCFVVLPSPPDATLTW